ncbi:hypothetical protein NSPZN2_40200 [Nitrospira defluvii]|uniref:Uncharacterized protein n=1 Tax=Nitrospira defluvii TaxID=330214 RepID=A0ABN7LV74_9BACT|nr:hypothetical protein NSPZN2_40200 [Nitrospira defluvii]
MLDSRPLTCGMCPLIDQHESTIAGDTRTTPGSLTH